MKNITIQSLKTLCLCSTVALSTSLSASNIISDEDDTAKTTPTTQSTIGSVDTPDQGELSNPENTPSFFGFLNPLNWFVGSASDEKKGDVKVGLKFFIT